MADIVPFRGGSVPSAQTAVGRVHDWTGPPWGQTLEYVEQSFATFEVSEIGGSTGTDPEPLQVARAIVSGAGRMPGCDALELRYVATPSPQGIARVQMFITAKSSHHSAHRELAAAAASAAAGALPKTFVTRPTECRWMYDDDERSYDPIFVLRRNEDVTAPSWTFIPAGYYYEVGEEPGDGSGWAAFWRSFAAVSSPVTVSILFKQTELDDQEVFSVGQLITQLSLYAQERHDYDGLGRDIQYPACSNAAHALESWVQRRQAIQRPFLARVAMRGAPFVCDGLAPQLAAAIAMSGSSELKTPMWVDAAIDGEDVLIARDAFNWLEVVPWGGIELWRHPDEAPKTLQRFQYLFGVDEAARLAVLPVPDEQGVPGFARASRIAPRRAMLADLGSKGGVPIGRVMHEGSAVAEAQLPLSAINRHVLVVGTPGSGKTTTVLTLLASLWRDFAIPFLVIEPSKSEYRTLLDVPGMEALRVVVLGRDDIAPIRLNPLAPPDGVRMEVQANAVLAALKAAMSLKDPLPELLSDAIERAYKRAGWDYDTTNAEGLQPPSLRTVMSCFAEAFEEADYRGDARNVSSAMNVRLKSLVRGSKGRVLDTVEATDFGELLARPVVIELDEIADAEDKAIMATFLLDRVRAGARAKGSSGGDLRHVTVIEEAHRLLARVSPSSGDSGESARAAGVEAFCNAIAELRSLGEGFILCSQSPSRLASAAVDNCGTRFLHRIESAADRDIVLADLDANQLEREAAARLRTGEAIARWPELEEPEFIEVRAAVGIDSGRALATEEVRQRMLSETMTVRRLLPHALCTREVCTGGCDPGVRATGEDIANDLGKAARRAWDEHDGTIEALGPIAKGLRREASGDLQTAYCGAVHLAAFGHALNVRRRVDIRPAIQSALEGEQ